MPSTGDSFDGRDALGERHFYAWYQTQAGGDGVWFDIRGIKSAMLFTEDLLEGDSFSIQISGNPIKPEDTDDGYEVTSITGSDETFAQNISLNTALPSNWCKINKDGNVGEAYAYLNGLLR